MGNIGQIVPNLGRIGGSNRFGEGFGENLAKFKAANPAETLF